MKQIPGEIAEKLVEQAKHTAKAYRQTPKTVFQRMVGERTDEEKDEKQKEESGLEGVVGTGGQQAQPPLSQTDLRRREIVAHEEAKRKQMQKILHKRLFTEAERARKRRDEEERLKRMKEEEEQRKKDQKQMTELKEKEKEEALAVKFAKRAKGAGEFGPKAPK